MGGAARQIAEFNPQLAGLVGPMTAIVGVSAALATSVASLGMKFATTGGQLADLSARLAMPTDAIQKLSYAAERSGVDFGAVVTSVEKMQMTMAKSPEKFRALGLSVQDLLKLAPDKQFQAVAEAIRAIENPTLQAQAAMAVFGESGAKLLPLIRAGVTGLADEAEQLGFVMSKEQVEAADRLDDALTALGKVWDGLLVNMGSAIASSPALVQSLRDIAEVAGGASRAVQWLNRALNERPADWKDPKAGLQTAAGLFALPLTLPFKTAGKGLSTAAYVAELFGQTAPDARSQKPITAPTHAVLLHGSVEVFLGLLVQVDGVLNFLDGRGQLLGLLCVQHPVQGHTGFGRRDLQLGHAAGRSNELSPRRCRPPGEGRRVQRYDPLMKAGLIGLSSSGKSTLFSLLTGAPAPPPGGRPEARVGIAPVPDSRVDALAKMYQPKKTTFATVEYVDVPGVGKGEGAALVDLPALRGVDALVHVVRAFESELAPHPDGSVDPLRDARMLDLELILADLGAVEQRLERLDASIKKLKKAEDVAERELFLRLKEALETERPLRELELTEEERRRLRNYSFLSAKPLLLAVNLGEEEVRRAEEYLESSGLNDFARAGASRALCAVSAPIEAEMAQLAPDDARAFREDLGLLEPGLDRVARTSYALLGLISFLTAGEDECRAWTIRKGTKAPAAAGGVHSDIERGFIRAETVAFEDLVAAGGSLPACRERGTLRLEGKEYVVRDGDVINFRFAV